MTFEDLKIGTSVYVMTDNGEFKADVVSLPYKHYKHTCILVSNGEKTVEVSDAELYYKLRPADDDEKSDYIMTLCNRNGSVQAYICCETTKNAAIEHAKREAKKGQVEEIKISKLIGVVKPLAPCEPQFVFVEGGN